MGIRNLSVWNYFHYSCRYCYRALLRNEKYDCFPGNCLHRGYIACRPGAFGFPDLIKGKPGTTSFSWVMLLNTFIAIIVAYFQKTGAMPSFSQMIHDKNLSRRGAQLMAWVLGIFVYFSDSFSPLFVGTTMRSITDKAKISREKWRTLRILRLLRSAFWCRLPDGAAYLSGSGSGNRMYCH